LDDIPYITTRLFTYQKAAVSWVQDRELTEYHYVRGGMLCDEMGLGKTLTLLATIAIDKAQKRGGYPTVVVCSKTLLTVWQSEIKKHIQKGKMKVLLFQGTSNKNITAKQLRDYDIVLTTYDTISGSLKKITKEREDKLKKLLEQCIDERDKSAEIPRVIDRLHKKPLAFQPHKVSSYTGPELLFHVTVKRLICDEAHEFRNPTTKKARAVQSISAIAKWFVSGTPVHNNSLDLLSALKFLGMKHEWITSTKKVE